MTQYSPSWTTAIIITSSLFFSFTAFAFKDDIRHTELANEQGSNLPTGNNIPVTHVEALSNGFYMPDANNAEFSGKTITPESQTGSAGVSSHATGVGKNFYGNSTSIAPDITNISAYNVDYWLASDFLMCCFATYPWQPFVDPSRVANHSYVGDAGTTNNADILRRIDWVVNRDESVHAVGLNNGSTQRALLSSAFNVVSVGRTDGNHPIGSAFVDNTYTADRSKPDIVAPASTSSAATGIVSSAAALLVEAGHRNGSLSTDPDTSFVFNRSGNTVYNAERAMVVKAALMAGADRITYNSGPTNIVDYRENTIDQTSNGLDRRFGAGQLNVYDSYHMVAAGEQNSAQDEPSNAGAINATGFDYDPHFGGLNNSNDSASYFFSVDSEYTKLWASLVWEIRIDGGSQFNFDDTANLYNLDIELYDRTNPALPVLIGSSTSTSDNTEHLWRALEANHDYELRVIRGAGQAAFDWDYALAWKVGMPPDTDGDGVPDEFDLYPDDPSRWEEDPCGSCHI